MRKQLQIMIALLALTFSAAGQSSHAVTPQAIATRTEASALRVVALLDLPGAPGFSSVAIARGMVLTSHPSAGTVELFDRKKRRLVGRIRDLSSPRGIAVDEGAGRVYIANFGAKNIVVVDAESWQVVDKIAVAGHPAELALAGQRLWVSLPEDGAVAALDLAHEGAEIGRVALGSRSSGLCWDVRRQRLWVSLPERRTVAAISPGLAVDARYELDASTPTGIACGANKVYVAVRYAVLELDPATGREVGRAPTSAGVDQLTLDEKNARLLAASNGAVFVADVNSGLREAREVGVEVRGPALACDAATGIIYLPGGREGKSKMLVMRWPGE